MDTESGICIIGEDFYKLFLKNKLKLCTKDKNNTMQLRAANNQLMQTIGNCNAKVKFKSVEVEHIFHIVPDLKEDIIIGNDLLEKFQAKIYVKEEIVIIDNTERVPIRIKVLKNENNNRINSSIIVKVIHKTELIPNSITNILVKLNSSPTSQNLNVNTEDSSKIIIPIICNEPQISKEKKIKIVNGIIDLISLEK